MGGFFFDFEAIRTASRPRRPAQVEAEKQAASGLAKMGLVDPSLRKKEHGPKAAAKKAQRLYNSVVHGVADKRAEQQETSNMTQSLAVLKLTLNLTRTRRARDIRCRRGDGAPVATVWWS